MCIYDRESISMYCISLAGSLCASFSSDNKLKLVITRATACLTVTCVLHIHEVGRKVEKMQKVMNLVN